MNRKTKIMKMKRINKMKISKKINNKTKNKTTKMMNSKFNNRKSKTISKMLKFSNNLRKKVLFFLEPTIKEKIFKVTLKILTHQNT